MVACHPGHRGVRRGYLGRAELTTELVWQLVSLEIDTQLVVAIGVLGDRHAVGVLSFASVVAVGVLGDRHAVIGCSSRIEPF